MEKVRHELETRPQQWSEWYTSQKQAGIASISCSVPGVILACGLRPDRLALIVRDFVAAERSLGEGGKEGVSAQTKIPDTVCLDFIHSFSSSTGNSGHDIFRNIFEKLQAPVNPLQYRLVVTLLLLFVYMYSNIR